jgi:hypothetical protein
MKRIDSKTIDTTEFEQVSSIAVNLKFRCFETAFNSLCNQIFLNRISEMSFRRLYNLFNSNGL